MSISTTIQENWHDIMQKKAAIDEALCWSESGINFKKECLAIGKSDEMKKLADSLASEKGNGSDRFKVSEYLVNSLEFYPEINLPRFVEYLDEASKKIASKDRSEYYINIREKLLKFLKSNNYQAYLKAYNNFMEDKSREAVVARHAMVQIKTGMQRIMGKYA